MIKKAGKHIDKNDYADALKGEKGDKSFEKSNYLYVADVIKEENPYTD